MFIVNGVSGSSLHCINFGAATDPACGSGNFLTESFISIRRLENEVILELDKERIEGQLSFSFVKDSDLNVKVSIQQFYGIEINDFAVSTSKTALWIAEAQMLSETKSFADIGDDFLPLKTYTNIVEGNALKSICNVSPMLNGSMPNDGGILSDYTTERKNEIIKKYPIAEKMFKPFLGATEFINNKSRWCLWLKDISPSDIKKVPPVLEAIAKVKEMRGESTRIATKKLADTPSLFGEIRQPSSNYIIIPRHSSQIRRYVPMGFMSPDIICGDANMIIPNASLFEFGILTSNVHNAWIRVVAGRIKSDFRYSANIVYNNFPWCPVTESQKIRIEQTAQNILDARSLYSECSLASLYDPLTMPQKLRKAHVLNDKAVMDAYGFSTKMTEEECVGELMKMYQELL